MATSMFKKRPLDASRVAAVEAAAAGVPVSGEQAVRVSAEVPQKTALVVERLVPAQVSGNLVDTYVVGGVYDVPLNFVMSNPIPPRYLYPESDIDKMRKQLAKDGQQVSATGFLSDPAQGDRRVVLIDGETRLRGARAEGFPTLRVEIKAKPESDQALYEQSRSANKDRRDQTALDDAMRWKELIERKVYASQKSLGLALGVPEDVVSRTISLASLSPLIVGTIAEYPDLLNLKMLVALREYWEETDDDKTMELIIEVAKHGLGARDVVARRKAAQKPESAKARPRAHREEIHYKGAKGELKAFEKDGRLELSLKGLSPETSADLTIALKKVLGLQTQTG